MAYTKHTFSSGDRLAAATMTAIDTQVETNYTNIAALQTNANGENLRTATAIKKLSLSTDGQYIILSYDGVVVSEVAIADVSQVIRCEGLVLTSQANVSLMAGATSQVTWQITPSDCTQKARLSASNISIANVSSTGLITAVDAGISNVYVKCGNLSVTVKVSVSKSVTPTYAMANYLSTSSDGTYLAFMQTGANGAYGIGTTEATLIKVPAGFTLTGNTQTPGHATLQPYFNCFYAFAKTADTKYEESGSGYPLIKNITDITQITFLDQYNKTFSFSATKDMYIAGILRGSSSIMTEEELSSFNTDYGSSIVLTLSPTTTSST